MRTLVAVACMGLASAGCVAASPVSNPLAATPTTKAVAATAADHADARFDVESAHGRVERIVMHAADGESYVFDGFVADEAAIRDESRRVAARPPRPNYCVAAQLDAAHCEQTCGWIETARPFTRVTRRSADGRSTVLRNDAKTPMRLNAGAGSHTGTRGDCASPDGRYLSILAVVGAGADAARPAIVELREGVPDARFSGRRTGKVYGEDRYFDFVGWLPGQPHVLKFSYGGDGEPVADEAVP